ncbi:SPFH domain-containing protein [Secundilactobacillus malefermentans]|uniref:Band 7 domain-containing protein n=1 Tax=Secundilactobacillus malefermentans TaxID=176292 RepID=A0A4R5NSI9_9LACO|nr:SPFH domain-containing protein [Secundilactobacillus malefermentans]KRM58006.1 hypothetical protein FD44_GL000875 [Secundilactobacillus malefermentans DSM 5705 = KCTC 3548]QEA32164.1 SPFH domain-containing protein [Secundilactobacillus malefermentans]TDG80002.1 hypothetical protein C5L31_000609 [Secundilactobacillus malefermentans]
MEEKSVFHVNGFLGLIVAIIAFIGGAWLLYLGSAGASAGFGLIFLGTLLILVALLGASSLTIVQPNEASVLTFFGRYIGTIADSGIFLTVPLTHKSSISLRVRNFNSQILKVNDSKGNPVEIAAVIVFKVVDTANALFSVDNYEEFVEIQSESAIRHIATEYPYDTFESEDELTLRGNSTEVSNKLTKELQNRLEVAGVEIIETRLTHLAYATEIASAMLQRQQSTAILSARKIIVDGAVSITREAVERLAAEAKVEITDAEKLRLINNVMVSIITERGVQPVINTDRMK